MPPESNMPNFIYGIINYNAEVRIKLTKVWMSMMGDDAAPGTLMMDGWMDG